VGIRASPRDGLQDAAIFVTAAYIEEVLGKLRLEKHPDKTFIGRIERGFDFLGYHFGPEGLFVAKKTIERYVERAIRLYEQEPGAAFASTRLGLYVQHWIRWARSGLEHFAHEKQGAAQQGPSGTIKYRMGYTHFQMKTLQRVGTEMALHVLAYNIKRVINIVRIRPLIAAMKAA